MLAFNESRSATTLSCSAAATISNRWPGGWTAHLFFSANHVFSSLTGGARRRIFCYLKPPSGARNRNGHMLARANSNAAALADRAALAEVGGSDAHAMGSVAAPIRWRRARSKEEFLDALRMGQGRCAAKPVGFGN